LAEELAADTPAETPDDADDDAALPPDATFYPVDEARLPLRLVGYCVLCDALVERTEDGSCAAGHPQRAITGRLALIGDEAVPQLPRFNLAAFLVPPLWGPFHGQWAGAFLLPIWLFADSSVVAAANLGGWMWIPAIFVIAGTAAFQYFFATKANGLGFRRVMGRMSLEEYLRKERIWAIASVPVAIALVSWAVYFDVFLGPALRK
jgi:hypothetical protein